MRTPTTPSTRQEEFEHYAVSCHYDVPSKHSSSRYTTPLRHADAERRSIYYNILHRHAFYASPFYFPNHDVFLLASFLAFCYRNIVSIRICWRGSHSSGRRGSVACSNRMGHTHCSLQSLYALFASVSRSFHVMRYTIHSLEEINTHSSLSTIALQTLYALVCRFLTWIEVLAISFAARLASVPIAFMTLV
jgi:hypothetical protein